MLEILFTSKNDYALTNTRFLTSLVLFDNDMRMMWSSDSYNIVLLK